MRTVPKGLALVPKWHLDSRTRRCRPGSAESYRGTSPHWVGEREWSVLVKLFHRGNGGLEAKEKKA